MKKLLIATNNPGKMREIRALLHDEDFELVTPAQIGIELEIAEEGATYAENAAAKANAYALASQLITLADDSGLEVDALDGLPGLHSARFAPQPGASDADRRRILLERLRDKPRPWLARFCCWAAIAQPNGTTFFTQGVCQGEIIPEERGENGFGYDPIFYLPELGKTMAELSMDEKNRLSHRARAVRAALPILKELLLIL